MKKIIGILLSVFLLVSGVTIFAQDAFCVKVPTVFAKTGEIVQMDVVLENNSGILALLFELTYDTERLKLVGAEDMALVSGPMFSPSAQTYPYKLLWNSASSENFTQDGTLVRLQFEVLANAPAGMAKVELSFEQENIFDVNLVDVPLRVINGGVEVISDTPAKPESVMPSSPTVVRPSSGGSPSGDRPQSAPEVDKSEKQIVLTIGKKEAVVFGETKTNDVAPKIVMDRTMLPARFVAEALGAQVMWSADEPKRVDIRKGDVQILLHIDSDIAYINGVETLLDSPAFLENDRTYTPVRFVAEALGAKVDWEEVSQKVIITIE